MLIRASALGGIAVVFGEYLLRSLGVDPVEHYIVARGLSAGAIAFAACANILGANVGAAIVGVSTAAKFSALVVLVGASFLLGGGHGASRVAPDRGRAGTDRRSAAWAWRSSACCGPTTAGATCRSPPAR